MSRIRIKCTSCRQSWNMEETEYSILPELITPGGELKGKTVRCPYCDEELFLLEDDTGKIVSIVLQL